MANRYPLIYNSNANQLQEIQSGDNLDLTSSGISSVGNINSTGIITATSFSGTVNYASIAGIATYADIAGIATVAQGLTGSPSITVSGVNASGVITATSFSGDGANLTNLPVSSGGGDFNELDAALFN